jgi:hypothetical protein
MSTEEILAHKEEIGAAFGEVYTEYRVHQHTLNEKRHSRIAEIKRRIDQLLKRLDRLEERADGGGVARESCFAEIAKLEEEHAAMDRPDEDLLSQLKSAIEVSRSLWQVLNNYKTLRRAAIWDVLVKSVTPIMREDKMRNGKTRTKVVGFRYEPAESLADAVRALEIRCVPRDTD